jgi:hypothetical protein
LALIGDVLKQSSLLIIWVRPEGKGLWQYSLVAKGLLRRKIRFLFAEIAAVAFAEDGIESRL